MFPSITNMPRQIRSARTGEIYYWFDTHTSSGSQWHTYTDINGYAITNIDSSEIGEGKRFEVYAR